MTMIVDKAGGYSAALGIDRARRGAAQLADFDDLAVLDANIAPERGHLRAVDNKTILDQQVIRHRFFLSAEGRAAARDPETRLEVYALRALTQCSRAAFKAGEPCSERAGA